MIFTSSVVSAFDGQSKNVDVIVCIEFKNGRRRITTTNRAERFITGTLISGIPAGFCDVIVISCCNRDHVYTTSSLVTNSQVSGLDQVHDDTSIAAATDYSITVRPKSSFCD